jgi:hypothetical protein
VIIFFLEKRKRADRQAGIKQKKGGKDKRK